MLKEGRKRKRKELRKKERQRAHKLDCQDLSSRFSASHHSVYLCLKTSYSPPRHLRSPLQIDQIRT